ncbi:MAG: ATP-binding protein, partial [Lachnospiraceae bacterium]|nr:ATP-binding protein [Lachnospiraceae bacterium]
MSPYVPIIFAVIVIAVAVIVCRRIIKGTEERTIIYQNKLLKQQMDEIETMYLTMRGWRHDYHNHLQSLKG